MIDNIAISNWYTKGQSLSKQPHRTASISLPMPTSFQHTISAANISKNSHTNVSSI